MFVEFVSGPKAGTREHIAQPTASMLVAAGYAIEVPMTLEERKALESTKQPGPGSVAPPYVAEPTWTVEKNVMSGEIHIVRRYMSQTTYMTGVPKDLSAWPWRELTKARAKQLGEEQEAMIKNGGNRPIALPWTAFGRK